VEGRCWLGCTATSTARARPVLRLVGESVRRSLRQSWPARTLKHIENVATGEPAEPIELGGRDKRGERSSLPLDDELVVAQCHSVEELAEPSPDLES
jgi:hypothetical protein